MGPERVGSLGEANQIRRGYALPLGGWTTANVRACIRIRFLARMPEYKLLLNNYLVHFKEVCVSGRLGPEACASLGRGLQSEQLDVQFQKNNQLIFLQ